MNAAQKVDVLTSSAPPRIWLQVDVDGDPDDRSEAIDASTWDDLTWHFEPIGGQEVKYVRADFVADLIAAGDFMALNATPGMFARWDRARANVGSAS